MTHKPSSQTFSLPTYHIIRFLFWAIVSLLGIHLVLQFTYHVLGIDGISTLRGRFDVDNEISIPTWFSQILLLLPALVGLVLCRLSLRSKDGNALYWALFGGLFIFLSADEGAMLHEAFVTKFREWTVSDGTVGLGAHTWLIPVGLVFLLLLIPFVQFAKRLPKKLLTTLVAGLGVYVFGAIIYETIGLVVFAPLGGFWYEGLNVAIEEGLEMFGVLIVLLGLLNYLKTKLTSISITIT